jgi:1-deoxy-D-xylulose-5-phosphate reductoisomerase
MKSIVILGSTGSIGTQALDIVRRMPGRFRIVGLAANRNAEMLAAQANEFDVPHVSIGDDAEQLSKLRTLLSGRNSKVHIGVEGMCELSTLPEADLVVVSVAGAIGIKPTHAALQAGKSIALASKEVLVAAGDHTMRLAAENGCKMLPIDSEHSALFQCLEAAPDRSDPAASVDKLILTASGGPFRSWTKEQMADVTPEQALKHPNWEMGALVTINSATLMNKGLEVIEAHWLFGVPIQDVDVLVHPQSIIHSMVQFKDASVLAQLGLPDMRLPIQYALVYPDRIDTDLPRMNLAEIAKLDFEKPDLEKFPSLRLARKAVERGGTLPAVMNAANESAVALFLHRQISFPGIMNTVEQVMDRHIVQDASYQNVLDADAWARAEADAVNGVNAHA